MPKSCRVVLYWNLQYLCGVKVKSYIGLIAFWDVFCWLIGRCKAVSIIGRLVNFGVKKSVWSER